MLNAAASSQPTCCVPRLGSLSPYDFANPRAALIKAVRALSSSARARIRVDLCLRCDAAPAPTVADRFAPAGPAYGHRVIVFSTALSDQFQLLRMDYDLTSCLNSVYAYKWCLTQIGARTKCVAKESAPPEEAVRRNKVSTGSRLGPQNLHTSAYKYS